MAALRTTQQGDIDELVRSLRAMRIGPVRVSRRGLFGSGTIESFVCVVGRHSLSFNRSGGQSVYAVADVVRGIGLDHHEVSKDAWFATLVSELDSLLADPRVGEP